MNKEITLRDVQAALKHLPLDFLTDWIGGCQPGSPLHTACTAEIERRRLTAANEAAKAAKRNVAIAVIAVAVTIAIALLHH